MRLLSPILFMTLAALVLSGTSPVLAQQAQDQSGVPVDILDIIVKGSATLKLSSTSFAKQSAQNTRPLNQRELDSLNSLEKQAPLLLARNSAPSSMTPLAHRSLELHAYMGLFQSPDLGLVYGDVFGQYRVNALVNYSASTGFMTNADFSLLNIQAGLSHQALPGDGLFASSRLSLGIQALSQSYHLYASADSAPRRSVQLLSARAELQHPAQGPGFDAAIDVGQFGVTTETQIQQQRSESILQARVRATMKSSAYTPFAEARFNIHPYEGTTLSDNELGLGCSFSDSGLRASANIGFQFASNSESLVQYALAARIKLSTELSNTLRLQAELQRENSMNFYSTRWQDNPFMNPLSKLDVNRLNLGTHLSLSYHPSIAWESSLHLRFDSYGQYAVMQLDSVLQFSDVYVPAQIFGLELHTQWRPDTLSILTAALVVQSATQDGGASLPYVAPIECSIAYQRQIIKKLNFEAQLAYRAARDAQLTSTISLASYMLVNLSAAYYLTDDLSLVARAENLLNSSVFIFERYKERGAFVSAGIRWRF